MNIVKKSILTLGGIFLAAVLIAALAPKATHGIVAALVQVTNTTADPAVTLDADHATRIPYVSTVAGVGPSGACQATANCVFSYKPVPAGYRLVVENVSAALQVASGSPLPSGGISSSDPASGGAGPFFSGTYVGKGVQYAGVVSQTVKFYVNASYVPSVGIVADYGGGPIIGNNFATIVGYLENCSVTGCPPIQY